MFPCYTCFALETHDKVISCLLKLKQTFSPRKILEKFVGRVFRLRLHFSLLAFFNGRDTWSCEPFDQTAWNCWYLKLQYFCIYLWSSLLYHHYSFRNFSSMLCIMILLTNLLLLSSLTLTINQQPHLRSIESSGVCIDWYDLIILRIHCTQHFVFSSILVLILIILSLIHHM